MTLDEALELAAQPATAPPVAIEPVASQPLRSALGAVLRTLAAMVVSALLSLGAWQAFQWATHAPLFALQQIEVHGLVHAREGEVLRRSGLVRGENLFHADLAVAARGIEAHPWVQTARLYRRPPSRVVIEVVEHVAVASVQLGSLYLLDAAGAPFKKAAPGDGQGLPLLTGLARADFPGVRGGANATSTQAKLRLLAALRLLDVWKTAGLPLAQLTEVRLDDDGGLTAFARDAIDEPGRATQEIHLGERAFAQRLQRLDQIRAALARRGERAARIDLDDEARPAWASAQLDKSSQQK